MALSIDTSSIGISSSGMKKVHDDIKLNLIEESIKSFNSDCQNVIDNVDNYWHGVSAESFKIKVNHDRAKIEAVLKVLEEKMEYDLGVMATNTAIADAEVAGAIMGGSSDSSGGSSGSQGGALGLSAAANVHARDLLNKIDDMYDLKPREKTDPRNDLLRARGIDVDWHGEPSKFYDALDEGIYRTGATLSNYGTAALEGFSGVVEGVTDTAAVIGTGIASVGTGLYDGLTYAGSKITGNEWHSVTADMWDGTRAFVAQDMTGTVFNKLYNDTDVGNRMKESSYFYKQVKSAGKATGAVQGLKTISALALTGSGANPKKAPLFTVATATVSGFGKSTQVAYQNDLDGLKATGFGIENAAREGAKAVVGEGIKAVISVDNRKYKIGPITVGKKTVDKVLRKGPTKVIDKANKKLTAEMYKSAGIDYNPSKGTGDEVVGLTPTNNLRSGDFSRLRDLNKEANNIDVN